MTLAPPEGATTITVPEAAEALGVSERTVWRYLAAGRLPGETVGPIGAQRTLIPRAGVEALRRARATGADLEALRAERDRLAAALAGAQAERDRLAARVGLLQDALARAARPGPLARGLERGLAALSRPR